MVEQSFKGKSSRRVVTRDVMMCDFPAPRTPIDVGECLVSSNPITILVMGENMLSVVGEETITNDVWVYACTGTCRVNG